MDEAQGIYSERSSFFLPFSLFVFGSSFSLLQCESILDRHFDALLDSSDDSLTTAEVCESVCQAASPLTKLVPAIADMDVNSEPLMKLIPANKPLVKLVAAIADMDVMAEPLMKLIPAAKPLTKLVPAIADMDVMTEPLMKLVPANKPHSEGIGCTICTLIVGYAEDKLDSNATLAEIETFLNTTVCGFLPSFLQPECAALVDEYAPRIAANIEKGYPASVICEDVGLCSKNKKALTRLVPAIADMEVMTAPLVKLVAANKPLTKLVSAIADMEVMTAPLVKLVPASKPQVEGVGCTICTLIVGYAEDKLDSNATLAEIETFLNTTVCGFLPSFLRDPCSAIVDEYAPEIAEKFQKGYPASVICEDIHLCSSSKKLVAANKPQVQGIGCTICTLIVGYAEDKLDTNATLAEIETFLNTTVCGFLPSFLQPECDALVDEYAPVIAAKFQKGYPASVICTDIHVCSSSAAPVVVKPELMLNLQPAVGVVVKPELMLKLKPAANAIECSICRLVVNAAEEELGNGATESEIVSFLTTDVCPILPRLFRADCGAFVTDYVPELVAHILVNNNATEVCTKDLQVC